MNDKCECCKYLIDTLSKGDILLDQLTSWKRSVFDTFADVVDISYERNKKIGQTSKRLKQKIKKNYVWNTVLTLDGKEFKNLLEKALKQKTENKN